MTDQLPDPLVPPEVDLRDFAFMPLDVRRLRDSRLIAVRSAEEAVGAIILWSASWHQLPASSIPNDDVELSNLAGYGGQRGLKAFRPIKEGALHGFILCSDGRWYHPVVAEKAAEAWNGRLELEWRRAADVIRKGNRERKEKGEQELPIPPKPALLSMRKVNGIPLYRKWGSDGIPPEIGADSGGNPPDKAGPSYGIPAPVRAGLGAGGRPFERERERDSGKGQGKGDRRKGNPTDSSLRSESSGEKPGSAGVAPLALTAQDGAAPPPEKPAKTAAAWAAYREAYLQRYRVEPTPNATERSAMARFITLVPLEEAPAIAAFYVRHNKRWYVEHQHTVIYLAKDAAGIRTQWLNGRGTTETEARQADSTAANANVWGGLIEEARERERQEALNGASTEGGPRASQP